MQCQQEVVQDKGKIIDYIRTAKKQAKEYAHVMAVGLKDKKREWWDGDIIITGKSYQGENNGKYSPNTEIVSYDSSNEDKRSITDNGSNKSSHSQGMKRPQYIIRRRGWLAWRERIYVDEQMKNELRYGYRADSTNYELAVATFDKSGIVNQIVFNQPVLGFKANCAYLAVALEREINVFSQFSLDKPIFIVSCAESYSPFPCFDLCGRWMAYD
ncbi:MAG: hypothetical protein EZS28_046933 [Streblomastix strix]|uniref:Uncharacterized protein n=1 Tax=Streblomastix strix TaxID=222440 RepID=A0A5J4TIE8_9EUKA|nr:MAG: hypothetical protein EZS28_046933 [Streblomastix strix]